MTITELIKSIGDENIEVQFLHKNLCGVSRKKKEMEVKFVTSLNNGQSMMDAALTPSVPARAALILWFDSKHYPKP